MTIEPDKPNIVGFSRWLCALFVAHFSTPDHIRLQNGAHKIVFSLHSPDEWVFVLTGVDVINKRLLAAAIVVAAGCADRWGRLALATDSSDDDDGNEAADAAAAAADDGAGAEAVADVIVYGVVWTRS